MSSKLFSLRSNTHNGMQGIAGIAWRVLAIGTGYMLTSSITGWITGRGFEVGGSGIALLSGILVGVTLAPIAGALRTSHLSAWIIWGSALFFNALSLGIEGA